MEQKPALEEYPHVDAAIGSDTRTKHRVDHMFTNKRTN